MKPNNDSFNTSNMVSDNQEGKLYCVPISYGPNKGTIMISP